MSTPDIGKRVLYHPLPTRSPNLLALTGALPVVVKLADDNTGRAMLLFSDLTLAAAVPAEFTEDNDDRP